MPFENNILPAKHQAESWQYLILNPVLIHSRMVLNTLKSDAYFLNNHWHLLTPNFLYNFQLTTGKRKVVYIGITCGLSAPYVAGQLDYCMDHLDVFTPVVIGFNPTHLARYVSLTDFSCILTLCGV